MKTLAGIAAPGTMQFIIASGSWIVLARLVAETGHADASAGYQTAIRVLLFFILPAWGLSNAAATLVGQHLGAQQPKLAEKSVQTTTRYNIYFMAFVTVLFVAGAPWIIRFFTQDAAAITHAVTALRVISLGYIFYGIGMVMTNALNGAGDTRTPTVINFFGFWMFQVPFAWWLAKSLSFGPMGVFIAIPVAETLIALAAWMVFRRGKWKLVEV
jgi:Na+-driven multidrug efflux pump